MLELAIDIETYSETDIKAGVHKYVEDPHFEILLLAYCFTGKPTKVVDLKAGEKIPTEVLAALYSADVLKTAYNAAFEITCIDQHFKNMLGEKNTPLDPRQWSCTQALGAQAGLPFGLDAIASALVTIEQKDAKGKDLLKFFTMPVKPSKKNDMRTRNLPEHDFAKWLEFKDYCVQDVNTEQSVRKQLAWFKFTPYERNVWALDQKINNVGVMADMQLVRNAVAFDEIVSAETEQKLLTLAGITTDAQIKKHIAEHTGVIVKSLAKDVIEEVEAQFKGTPIEPILKLRKQLRRTSIKKFVAILNSVCADGRVRDLFQYYGANRTGRWAGRNVQLQNLKRNDLPDLDLARTLVREGQLDTLKLLYDDVGEVLSNLIRTAFVSQPGHSLVPSDFSAIEARIVAWFAGETWRLNVFNTHGKIYEASAAMMFNIKIDDVTKAMRQKGKIAELALGYQGAVGALLRMGGKAMGLSEDEMKSIVFKWRAANKQIVAFWKFAEQSAISALQGYPVSGRNLKFYMSNNNLIIELPSTRQLVYVGARYNGKNITYMGLDQETKRWCKQDTYGGKLVENITQATARDVLTEAMLRLDAEGFKLVMHVHDEAVPEVPDHEAEAAAAKLTQVLSTPIAWAQGLPLNAETFIAKYYQK